MIPTDSDVNRLADGRILILASTSPFRRELLARLQLPFIMIAPDVDETPQPDETGPALAARLAYLKARTIAAKATQAVVIGSDQVAVLGSQRLGKPLTHERAVWQLQQASGQTVQFHTGLCLMDSTTGRTQTDVVEFQVVFRQLTLAHIETYLEREQPYQCAGSFKSEGLGIALFERLIGDDPTSLIGLPLIRLVQMLSAEGIEVI